MPPSLYPITERLFIQIAPPEACRSILAELFTPMDGVRWTPIEQLHLTLRFLGDLAGAEIERLEEELARVQVEPFLLPLAGVGIFPPRGTPKVLWAGLGMAHTRLFQLRQRVDDAVLTAGWRGELRSFEPHITLGRAVGATAQTVQWWLRKNADFVGPSFRVDHFDLVSSDLGPGGAVHRPRRTFPLT